jgi:hypothetical protein
LPRLAASISNRIDITARGNTPADSVRSTHCRKN